MQSHQDTLTTNESMFNELIRFRMRAQLQIDPKINSKTSERAIQYLVPITYYLGSTINQEPSNQAVFLTRYLGTFQIDPQKPSNSQYLGSTKSTQIVLELPRQYQQCLGGIRQNLGGTSSTQVSGSSSNQVPSTQVFHIDRKINSKMSKRAIHPVVEQTKEMQRKRAIFFFVHYGVCAIQLKT